MSSNHNGVGQADATGIEHLDGLYSYAMVLSRNHAEAEDLVQETYVRAIQALGRLRAGSTMKSWLFTILRNIWLNQLRKRRSGPQMVEIEVEDGVANSIAEPSKNSHDLYVSKMEAEQVRAAIQELPVESREIILLLEYEDLLSGDCDCLGLSCWNRDVAFGESARKASCIAFGNVERV
jgi:RNA polymerase sigma-70 factor, ECF subfamily